MSSPPAAEASGSAGASSSAYNIAYQKCTKSECIPVDPAPSPEPTFHLHRVILDTGDMSAGCWGINSTSEAMNAAEAVAAFRSSSSGERRGNNSGERVDEKAERRKAGGTAAAAASVEQMEAVEALMLIFDRQPARSARPACPGRGLACTAPCHALHHNQMVPVWQVVHAADVSRKLGRDDTLHRLDNCVHYFSTSSPVRKGASSQGGVGVFATQPFEEQEVVMAFRRHCSTGTVSKRLAARRLLGLNRCVIHDGGDPIYLDVSTFGFPTRVMNNSDKPNCFVCTVTAGFSLEKYVFVFSLRSISQGEELFHDPVEGVISL